MLLGPVLVAITAFALLLAGCAGGGQTPPSARASEVETGIASVDAFLRLLAEADIDTIAADAAFEEIVCEGGTTYLADGAMLPCTGTDVAGTIADAIIKGCSPLIAVREEDLRQEIAWLADDSLKLEAVYTVPAPDGRWFMDDAARAADPLQPDYALHFSGNVSDASGSTLTVVFLTFDGSLRGFDDCDEEITSRRATPIWP